MPETMNRIAGEGTTFTDAVATTPLCCPSRAAMLTGQYGHNNGVLSNVPGYATLRDPENILPAWLQTVDYQTAEVGKWLQKEDTAPRAADHGIFKLAPLVVLVSTFLLVAAVPFGPDAWLTDFQVGVFYALAVSSISVLGWRSSGCIRT